MPGLYTKRITGKDILALKAAGDIPALVRLLGHWDCTVRSRAIDALAASGRSATELLIDALDSRESRIRLGAVDALGSIRDPGALPLLIGVARYDTSIDVRFSALLSLGESDDPVARSCCTEALQDANRYVRYAAAAALRKSLWQPPDRRQLAYYCIAQQDWAAVRELGKAAAGPLTEMLKDDEASTRIKLIELLSEAGTSEAADGCAFALKDPRDTVRYQGLLSAVRCGLSDERLPLLLARRERTGPNPTAAAILNFLFLGIGYNYIGKWWGFLVFMSFMSIIVLAQLQMGPFLPYILAYPVTAVLAVQTYYEAKRIGDLSGSGI